MIRTVLFLAAAIALGSCEAPGPGYELTKPERSRPIQRPMVDVPVYQQGAR